MLVVVRLSANSNQRRSHRYNHFTDFRCRDEEALMAYEADSARLHAQYQRIEKEIEAAKLRNDSNAVWALEDSLLLYAEPEYHPRGAIGFNIAGAFYLLFIVFLLIPLVIGIILLLYYRYKKSKFTRASNELLGP